MNGAGKGGDIRRVLIVDDTESIHRDFAKILIPPVRSESEKALEELDRLMFEEPDGKRPVASNLDFDITSAFQGEDGLRRVQAANEKGLPFSVAFIDMRMPPGWDGLRTVEEIFKADPNIQVVICSAYSDYSWSKIVERLGQSERLLLLKKPFDHAEVYQMAAALSEKWLAQQQTRDLLSQLEKKVQRRTAQLTEANTSLNELNAELHEALEEARAAERAKGRFLATMSHEIRTTLNGIIGASTMLNDSNELVPGDREFAQIIRTSGDALMVIINDILDYSKYESGQLELETIPFSLKSLARECAGLLDTSIRSNGIEFETNFDDNLPDSVVGDPARVRQVILNLLNNAVKFSKGGKVSLNVKVPEITDKLANIRIEISDTGIGMSQETIERLFSAFMQADTSTTREFGGTGLGLAICKLLADAMSARIEVESELQKGSTFSFCLSLPLPQAIPTRALAADDKAENERIALQKDFSGMKILLVDDNAINRKLGNRFLKKMNAEAELACNGKEAVDLVSKTKYDLVLMDLQMPEMDGVDATRSIRANGYSAAELPIVALTANAFAEVRDECMQAGMNDFLTKPLRIPELAATLDRWLSNREKESPSK